MDAVLGMCIRPVCPIIHNECGFGADEATKLKLRRNWTRAMALNRIYKTIVVSARLLDIALHRYKLHPEKVRLIQTGVDVEKFKPRRDFALRSRLGVTENTVLFGFVGGLRSEKNLPWLIRAFKAADLPEAGLVLMGDGYLRESLQALIRELEMEERVFITGHIQDPAPYFAAFDVFAMSSLTEQTPNALLEAMACGLPAVCTDVGDTGMLLGTDHRTTVVPPGDFAAYVGALRALATDPALRTTRGIENRRRAETYFSMQRMVCEYGDLYRSAVAR